MKRGVIVSSLVLLLVIVGVVLWLYGSRARNRCDDYAYIPTGSSLNRWIRLPRFGNIIPLCRKCPFLALTLAPKLIVFYLFHPSIRQPQFASGETAITILSLSNSYANWHSEIWWKGSEG